MEWHTRLTVFLLACLVLICINIAATINGVYALLEAEVHVQSMQHVTTFSRGNFSD